jgi:hypothetical protein
MLLHPGRADVPVRQASAFGVRVSKHSMFGVARSMFDVSEHDPW